MAGRSSQEAKAKTTVRFKRLPKIYLNWLEINIKYQKTWTNWKGFFTNNDCRT
uniref:Uncharacterized protein n=1 Tax=Tetranychus urticae TaxID=32264 RepID=T1JQ03_TETUR